MLASLPKSFVTAYSPQEVVEAITMLQFQIAWCAVQIGVALLHIVLICYWGTKVNEEVSAGK